MARRLSQLFLALLLTFISLPVASAYADEMMSNYAIETKADESEDITENQQNYGYTVQEIIDNAVEIPLNREIEVKANKVKQYDYLKFTIPEPGAVMIDLRSDTYDKLILYDSNKEPIGKVSYRSFSKGTADRCHIGLPAGTYYMDFVFWNNYDACTVEVKYTESEIWERELNETIATANIINVNSPVSGSYRDEGTGGVDKDFYKFSLEKAGKIHIEWEGSVPNDLPWNVFLFDSAQNELLSKQIRSSEAESLKNEELTLPAGTYFIEVTANWGNSDDYTITVNYTESNAITNISLNKSNADILIGDTLALTATVTPSDASNQTVSWVSSDENIATVTSEGLVTGINAGTATIMAKTDDGDKTATCVVTVLDVKLAAPVISAIENTDDGLEITWNKVSDADGYYVYRSIDDGGYDSIANVKDVSYLDDAATENGTKYSYIIYAYRTIDGKEYKSAAFSDKIYYQLSPLKIKSVKNNISKGLTVKWEKNAKGSGYQIQYGTSRNFKSAKTIKISTSKTTSKKITRLKKNKTYYVRVRPFKTLNKVKYYGEWTEYSKGVKIKK